MKLLRRFRNLLVPHRTKSRRPTNRDELFSSLRITRLERRIVLNGDAAGLELVALDAPNDGQADTFPVSHDGSNVAISVHEQDVATAPAGAGSAVQIQGSSDDDTNIIGFSADDPLQGVEMVVDGGEGMNTLALVGQGEVEVVDHQFVNESLSRVEFESATGVDSMTDANMESVNNPFVAQERQFQTGADPDEINLGVGVDPNDGVSQFDQGSGQNTDLFVNPIDNSVIDAVTGVEPDGDVVNDVVNILGADSRFRGDLLVHANASNSMVATPELDLGSGQLLTSVDNWSVETGTTKDTLVHFDTLDGEFEDPAISELQTSGTPGYDVFDSVDGESQVARWATHDATIDFSSPVFENLGSENLGSKNLGGQDGVPNEGILPSDVTTTGTSLDPSFSGDLVSKQSGPSVATLPMAQLDSLTILSAADDDRLTIDSTTHAIDLSVSFDHDRAEVAGGVTLGTVLAGALTTEDQGGTPAASAFRGATKGGPSVTVSGVGNDDEVFEVRNVDGSFQVLRDGVVVSDLSTTDTEIVIYGGGGDDVLEIADTSAIPAAGITFHGGAGEDDLNVSGTDVFLAPDATLGAGTVFADGGVIEFTGIEPNTITISDAAVVTLDLAGGDTLTFTEENATQTRVTGNSNSFVFTNPTDQLVINMTDGSDYTLIFEDLASDFNPGNGIQINGNAGTDIVTITDLGDSLTSAINIDLNALGVGGDDSVVFETNAQTPSTLNISAGTITTTTADLMVTDASFTSIGGGAITLGDLSAVGDLMIDGGGPVVFSGEVMVGGDLTASADGDVAINADVSATNSITISSGGAINGAGLVTASNAVLRAATGIGSGAPIKTAVTNLAFSNTTSGNVEIDNTGSLTIGSVGGQSTSTNTGGEVVLSASSPITFAVNTSSAGTLTAMALESATANFDNITVNAGVTVESTGADVVFEAGDRIIVNPTAIVRALSAGGDVTLDSGFGDTDGDGSMTLDGTVSANATNGVVTLDLNAQQGATQAVGGTLSGNGLRLLSTGASGSFGLGASTTNDVATIAAATGGTVAYRDSAVLAVGTVGGTVGITTSGGGITVTSTGDLSVGDGVTAGGAGGDVTLTTTTSGNVLLTSTVTADGDQVTINSAGAINGSGLVTAATVDLDAVSGIGNTISLELAAAMISADNTTGGGIDIDNTLATAAVVSTLTTVAGGTIQFDQSGGGTVSFGTVSTTPDGSPAIGEDDITLTNAGGDLTVTTSVTAGGMGDVLITTTTSGDVLLTGTVTADSDQVTINSAGAINGSGLVTAATVDLDAVSGIGNTISLQLVAAMISADNTTSGNIDIDNTLATATVVSTLTTAGGGTIRFDQSGGGNVSFGTVSTTPDGSPAIGEDDITLNNAGGDLTVTTSVTAGGMGDVLLTTTTSGDVLLTGTVTADGDQVTINSAGAINGSGLVTAATVDLDAVSGIGNAISLELAAGMISVDNTTGGGIDIDNTLATAAVVSTLTTVAGGTIQFDQSGGGTVSFGTVSTTPDGSPAIGEDDITLTNAGGDLTVTTSVTAGGMGDVLITTTTSGDVLLTGTVTADGDQVTINSAGAINGSGLVTAGTVDLDAVSGIGNAVSLELAAAMISADNTTSGNIDIDNTLATATVVSTLTTAGGGTIRFDQSGGGNVSFGTVSTTPDGSPAMGEDDITLTNTGGDLTVTTGVTAGGMGDVSLETTTSGNIIVNEVTAGNTISINSAGNISESGADPTADLTALNAVLRAATGIGSGAPIETAVTNLAFSNTTSGNVEIDNTGSLTIGSVGGQTTSSNAGSDVILSANSPITFAVNTSSAGTLTAMALESATVNFDNITVNAGVTVQSMGGDLVFEAGDRIIVNATAIVRALSAGGDVTLDSGFGDTDGDGSMTLDGTVSANATNGVVTLDLNAQQGATQSSVGTISGDGLRLLSTGASGSFGLDASTTNAVATIAAAAGGSVAYRDSSAMLSVSTVGGTVGITTSNDDITLCGELLSLTQNVSAGTGTVRLQANAGSVVQTGGAITAAALGVIASTNINLPTATNDVDTFAASAGGSVNFIDSDGYIIGTVTASGCFTGVTGLSGTDHELCVASGDINVTAAIVVTGTVRLQTGSGSITQTAAGSITAANLGVRATGDITLNIAPNMISGTFAAASTGAGSIQFANGQGFAVGTIAASGTCLQTIGVTTGDGSVVLSASSGDLEVLDAVTAGGAGNDVTLTTITSGDVLLTGTTTAAGDQVTIDSAGAINGSGLVTAGTVDLDAVSGIGNAVSLELAAAMISADNTTSGNIDIDNTLATATVVSTLTTAGGGTIQFDQSGGGNVSFGTVSTTPDGSPAIGEDDITLTNTGGDLTVTTGVTAGGMGDVLITTTTSGDVLLTGTVTADGDQVTINSAGAINGAGLVTASTVDLDAVSGIGNTISLELAAAMISADNTTIGNIDIDNTLATAAVVSTLTTAGGGTIQFDQSGGGNVSLGTVSTTPDGIPAVGEDDITLTNTGGDLTVTTSVTAGGMGDVLITTTTSGDVLLTGTVTADSDQVTINSAGAINGAGLVTASTVDLDAVSGIGNTISLELAAAMISADNTTIGNIDIDNTLATAAVVSTLTTAGGGTIQFDQSGGGTVSFGTVSTTPDGSPAIGEDDITLTNAGGDLTVTTSVTAGGMGDVLITTTTSGDVLLTGTVTADSDQVTINSAGAINGSGLVTAATVDLDAVSGIGNTISLQLVAAMISADNTTSGNIDIDNTLATATVVSTLTTAGGGTIRFDQSGGGNVSFGTVSTTPDGSPAIGEDDITLTNAGGDLTVTTSVTAGGMGDVLLTTTTSGDVLLTGTVTADGDQVTINSAGAINGSGLVTAATVDLDAVSGIGNAISLELAAGMVSADNTTSGNIDIDNTLATAAVISTLTTAGGGTIQFDQSAGGSVSFGTVSTTPDGSPAIGEDDITLTNAGGDLTVTTSVSAGGMGDVLITTTTSGDVLLTGTVTAAGDQVTINSAGAINGAGLVTASTVDLDAASGIGNTISLELAAAMISADNTTIGNIDIDNTLATAAVVSTLTTAGGGTIQFDQSGGGNVSLGTVSTTPDGIPAVGEDDITLTNTGGDLTVTTSVTAGGMGDVLITTTTSGDVLLTGTVTADSDQVTINSAGAINGAGLVTASTVDLDAVSGIGNAISLELAASIVSANTVSGIIDIDNDSPTVTLTAQTSGAGTISVDTTGELLIADVNTGSGNVQLTAGGSINESVDDTAAKISTTGQVTLIGPGGIGNSSKLDLDGVPDLVLDTDGSLNVTSSGTLINLAVTLNPSGGPHSYELADSSSFIFDVTDVVNDLMVNEVSTPGANLNFALTSDTGDILLDKVVVGTGAVTLDAVEGSISDANPLADPDVNNIIAGDLTLRADGPNQTIGANGVFGALELTISGILTATTANGSGGIFLMQTGDLVLNVVNADTGEIHLTASESINESVNDTAAKIITTGKVTLIGPEGIGNMSTLDLGQVSDLVLDTDMSLDVTSSGTLTDLAVTLNPGSGSHMYKLTDSSIFVFDVDDVVDDLMVNEVSTSGANLNFALTSDTGDILLDKVVVGSGAVTLDAVEGSISDANPVADPDANNITAGDLTLMADGLDQTIGVSGVFGALEIAIDGILKATTANGSGGIFLVQTGDLVLDVVDASTGDVGLTALGGSMTGVGGTAVVGDFLDLRVTGTGNDIGVSDTVRLAIDATMLHAESGGAIFIRDVTGSIILSDVAMPVAIDAAGAVWISAAEDVFVNGDVTTVDVTAITGAPTIKLEAIGGMVIVDTGVTIETKDSFGNTTARFSDEVFEPDALSGFKTILGTSDITVDGSAEINVTVEDVQGVDFALSIDWGDGSVEAVSSAVDPFMQIDGAISYALTHEYDPLTVNPSDPSVTAIVNIRGFGPESANPADDTIQLFANGSQMLPQATLAITLTLPSGFAIIAPLPQPEPLPQPVAVLGPLDVGFEFLTREPQPVVASTDTVTAGTAVETESRYYELRLVVFDENGELKEIEIRKLDEFIDEDGTKTRFELNLLSKLFKRLPNDRYRLYLHEEGTDRLVIEFVIDQGRPIRTPQTIETDSGTPDPTPQNADEAIGPGNQDNGQTEPAGDGRETPLSQPEDTPPESNQSRLLDPNGAANPRSRRDIALSETIGRTPFVAHGGLVITSRSFAPALKRT